MLSVSFLDKTSGDLDIKDHELKLSSLRIMKDWEVWFCISWSKAIGIQVLRDTNFIGYSREDLHTRPHMEDLIKLLLHSTIFLLCLCVLLNLPCDI